jgi:hypothetical protein
MEMVPDEIEAVIGSRCKEDDKNVKRSWLQMREICFYAFIAGQGNKKIKTPGDLIIFPWEDET